MGLLRRSLHGSRLPLLSSACWMRAAAKATRRLVVLLLFAAAQHAGTRVGDLAAVLPSPCS